MSYTQNRFNYDTKFDVLYYSIGDTSNSYGDEVDDRLILLRDINTDDVTGITVLDFIKYCMRNDSIVNTISKYVNVENVLNEINNWYIY